MKKTIIKTVLAAIITISVLPLKAGDEARWGSAGATQLLINGWARSSGWGNSNVAGVSGIESFFLNPAGLAKTAQTDLAFARTTWLSGTEIYINNFAFSQAIGKDGSDFIGISLMSFDMGNIPITTVQQPDGGLGTYRPSFLNLGFGYGKRFTNSINGGIVARLVQEQIPDINMSGIAFDAGVQYATSSNPDSKVKQNDLKLGIAIKNIGPDMRPRGDGLTFKGQLQDVDYESSLYQRAALVQLPSLIHIGGSYDINLDADKDITYDKRLTIAANFNYNPYSPNFTSLGMEFSFKDILMLRAGYNYSEGTLSFETRNDAHIGLCVGGTVQIPFVGKWDYKAGSNRSTVAIDYSFRPSNPFSGTHTFGLRVLLDNK
jgi:opacity protein-like surface antigen